MSKHLTEIQLQKYKDCQLSAAELISVIEHLENCENCREEFERMYPQISTAAASFNQTFVTKEEPFHLDYDEHLQPYIDETASEIDREIIESHLHDCAFCLQQVRELREFKQTLELKALKEEIAQKESENVWTKFINWFSGNGRILAFASLLIAVFAIGIFFFFKFNNQTDQVKSEPNANVAVPIQTVTTTPTLEVIMPSPTVETNINKPTPTITNANIFTPTPSPSATPQEPEMANLVLPKYLKDLQSKSDELRGSDDKLAEKIPIISPNGKVIRQNSPVLNWASIKDIQNYEISIYDENLNQLKKETISTNSWKVSVNLPKGRLYQWQVKAIANDKTYLGQGKFYLISQADENKIIQAKDLLERGKAFAEAGLLDEAKSEINKYLKQNPDSKTAKKWLQQLR